MSTYKEDKWTHDRNGHARHSHTLRRSSCHHYAMCGAVELVVPVVSVVQSLVLEFLLGYQVTKTLDTPGEER